MRDVVNSENFKKKLHTEATSVDKKLNGHSIALE
jgi:hypothetical protein